MEIYLETETRISGGEIIVLSQHSHTGSYSDFSFVEKICFFEDLNVVLKATRYDSGETNYSKYGNTDNFAKAQEIYERLCK